MSSIRINNNWNYQKIPIYHRTVSLTCCDRFDRNCVNIDNTEPPIPIEQSLYRIPWWLTLSKASLKLICMIVTSWSLSNALCSVCNTHTKVHHRYPNLSDKKTGWLEAHRCIPYIDGDGLAPGAQTP